MNILKILLFVLLVSTSAVLPREVQAQSQSLHLNLRVPYSYNVGYYSRFHDRLGFYADAGLVSYPFHLSMIGSMKLFGADKDMADVLKKPFRGGFKFEAGGQFYYGGSHRLYFVSVGVNYINLTESDIADEDANKAFDINLSDTRIPVGAIPKNRSREPLTLYSHFLQVSAGIGRRIPMGNDREIQLEFGIMKTVASHHRLYSDYRYLSYISDEIVNVGLQEMMLKHGYFPYVNATYIIHFERF